MSKIRKSTRAMIACGQLKGHPSSAIHWPATSSTTTKPGSSRPDWRAAIVAAGMPKMSASAMPTTRMIAISPREGWNAQFANAHRTSAATEPHVPGPGLSRPAPKNVATANAHFVVCCCAGSVRDPARSLIVRASARVAKAAQILQYLRIEHRGTDLVNARCPLAEVDLPTAVAAEGKIFILWLNNRPASGTSEYFDRFLFVAIASASMRPFLH